MQQKKLLLSIVFTIIVSSSLLGAYAVQILASQTPRGGDEAADGFINAAEESDGTRIQIIVNFTNSDQDANAGASIGDDVYLLNGTAGQQGIFNFTTPIINTIDTTEFNQKSVNFTVTKALLGGSDGPFEIHAQINNGTAGLISSAPGLVFILDTALPAFSSVFPATDAFINDVSTASSDISYTLSEGVASGTITITNTGGTAGGDGTCTFQADARTSGAHNNFELDDTTNSCTADVSALSDGGIYTFAFDATDAAGNAATTVSRTGVTFDTTAPTFTASTTTTTTTTVTFDEAINGGNFVAGDWNVAGVAATGIAPSGAAGGETSVVLTHATIGVDDTPSVQYTAGNLADSAGNLVAGNTVTATDGNPEVVVISSGGGHVPNPPPSFTTAFSEDELPFLLNGNEIDISNFVNIVETTQLKTGDPVNITLLVFDVDGIDYVGLYTNLRGSERERYQSDTIIEWRNGQGLLILDPNEYFEDANVNISKKGNKMEFSFDITFANPMEKSDLVLYVWDSKRNTVQTTILDAWEIIEENKPKTPFENEPETPTDDESDSTSSLTDVRTTIDDWSGFTENTASDSEMLQSIGLEGDYIPHWVKKLGKWVHNGTIDHETLINTIRNLHERGIVL